jgi:hypothetical protein
MGIEVFESSPTPVTSSKNSTSIYNHTRGLLCAVESCNLPGGMLSGQKWYCRHHHEKPFLKNDLISSGINQHIWMVNLFEMLMFSERFFDADGVTAQIVTARLCVDEELVERFEVELIAKSKENPKNPRVLAYAILKEFDKRVGN